MSLNLFGEPATTTLPLKNRSGSFNVNPCLAVYGAGPDGKKCKGCKHLVSNTGSRTFYKCGQRSITNGAATDHQVYWPACGRFEEPNDKGQLIVTESQLTAIKKQLLDGKRLTVQSVLKTVRTQELRTYIPILRRAPHGLDIADEWVKRNGKRFKEYYLKK